jgi:hypothetical protein
LHHAARCGTHYVPKRGAKIANISVYRSGSVELGVIEGVERLDSEQKSLGFREGQGFGQRHVVIIDSGAMKKSAARCSRGAQRVDAEQRRIEVLLAVFAGVMTEFERAWCEVRLVDPKVVDAVGSAPSRELSPRLTSVTGNPVLNLEIPDSDQPFVKRLAGKNFAKGSWYS